MAGLGWGLKFRITGQQALMRSLRKLPPQLQYRTMRNALSAGAGVLKRGIQARSPVRTGLMKRSMRVQLTMKEKRRKRGEIAYRVAPKNDKKAIAKNKSGKLRVATEKRISQLRQAGATMRYANPVNYAHLVELGHARRGGGRVPGLHFMRKAFRATRRQALQRITEKIRAAIRAYRGSAQGK